MSTVVESTIFSLDYQHSKGKLYDFLSQNAIKIKNQNENLSSLNIEFVLTPAQFETFERVMATLGHSVAKKVNTINNYAKITEINHELAYLKNKNQSYESILKQSNDNSPNFLTLWNEQKVIEEKVFIKERELLQIQQSGSTYQIKIELMDESTRPENNRVSFVNMPGFEFSMLMIESPKVGISPSAYHGYFLKYLFTKGKSFATMGAYKGVDIAATDTTVYSEMFLLGFGQDFYSRHLGRGTKKFLNLYSGYTLGGILATGRDRKSEMVYLAPCIGLELFKNRFMLIDTKVNYFVPLGNNRNLRGVSVNGSFNFVF
jgi:hypothetical protein